MSNNDELKSRFGFIDEKLNDMKADIGEVKLSVGSIDASIKELAIATAVQNQILVTNTEQLREHIRRTNLLEIQVEQTAAAFRQELRPVEDHVRFINRAVKVISWVVAIAASTAAILRVLGK